MPSTVLIAIYLPKILVKPTDKRKHPYSRIQQSLCILQVDFQSSESLKCTSEAGCQASLFPNDKANRVPRRCLNIYGRRLLSGKRFISL